MTNVYLEVPFREKDHAKSLGARFDSQSRQWYVPEGRDVSPFSAWLPAAAGDVPTSRSLAKAASTALEPSAKGIPLSQLLGGVGAAIAQAYKAGVWTTAEVLRASPAREGHVYLELSERDADGRVVAKTQAAVWASTAAKIIPEFERATGAVIGPGIKLLLRARPVFKAQYGFTLEIDAIDPEYTLGDLEARKREIRGRLQNDGVFERNRALPAPWDFASVLVVAPEQGAGLGDFQQEAMRLEKHLVCRFIYVYARFQGEVAAPEILGALKKATSEWSAQHASPPDVIVIIRGGGAVNDLAWLNDYALARFICDSPLPVFTGIGHQRDSTILDEVAHTSFDTPSKVIAAIELQISRRSQEAGEKFRSILERADRSLQRTKTHIAQLALEVKAQSRTSVSGARGLVESDFAATRLAAFRTVHEASTGADSLMASVRQQTVEQVALAKHEAPTLLAQVRERASSHVRLAKRVSNQKIESVVERGRSHTRRLASNVLEDMKTVAREAGRSIEVARTDSEALVREVSGQGPQKTLGRGFAMVRNADGKTIANASDVQGEDSIQVNFHDGAVNARVVKK